MAKIAVNEDYSAKAADVWQKLSDFGGLDGWMPGVGFAFDRLFAEGSYSGAQQFYWVTEWIFGIVFLVGAYMLMQERSKASA